jgi:hypothetical protein
MNKYIKSLQIFLLAAFSVAIMQSCTNLDEEVFSSPTGKLLLADKENAIYLFGSAYTYLYPLYGHKFGMGYDCGTDLLCVPQRGGDWEDGGQWHRYHWQTWTAGEDYIRHLWQNAYYAINTVNRLIYQFQSLKDFDSDAAVAELKALRAFLYWRLLDAYGNVPIVDKFPLPDGFLPEQSTRQEVYNFVESELLDAMPSLSTETGVKYYGRMNYYTAQMVLAKLYLNAKVYTGTEQLEKANAAIDEVIKGGYTLTKNSSENFVADASGSTEVIFGIAYDRVEAKPFEIHVFTLHYNLQEKYGLSSKPWNGLCAQEYLYNVLAEDPNDTRINGLLYGFQFGTAGDTIKDASYEKSGVAIDPDGAALNLTPQVNMLMPNCLRQAGARIAKFPFIAGSDGNTSNDFSIFRFADALLMKAEIVWRINGMKSDDSEALGYINQVRERSKAADATEITAQSILDERARELFVEGHRRTDMIRFGVYAEARWEKPDVSPDYVNLWPIPTSELLLNSNLTQNTGY